MPDTTTLHTEVGQLIQKAGESLREALEALEDISIDPDEVLEDSESSIEDLAELGKDLVRYAGRVEERLLKVLKKNTAANLDLMQDELNSIEARMRAYERMLREVFLPAREIVAADAAVNDQLTKLGAFKDKLYEALPLRP